MDQFLFWVKLVWNLNKSTAFNVNESRIWYIMYLWFLLFPFIGTSTRFTYTILMRRRHLMSSMQAENWIRTIAGLRIHINLWVCVRVHILFDQTRLLWHCYIMGLYLLHSARSLLWNSQSSLILRLIIWWIDCVFLTWFFVQYSTAQLFL